MIPRRTRSLTARITTTFREETLDAVERYRKHWIGVEEKHREAEEYGQVEKVTEAQGDT